MRLQSIGKSAWLPMMPRDTNVHDRGFVNCYMNSWSDENLFVARHPTTLMLPNLYITLTLFPWNHHSRDHEWAAAVGGCWTYVKSENHTLGHRIVHSIHIQLLGPNECVYKGKYTKHHQRQVRNRTFWQSYAVRNFCSRILSLMFISIIIMIIIAVVTIHNRATSSSP